MNLPAYPKYKPSGVEWLGDVPEEWNVVRSDSLIESEKRQVSPEVFAEEEVFHYSIPAVQEFGTGLVEPGESIASAKQVITEPVVLVSRLNPRKATLCRAEPQPLRTLASTEFVALRSKRCDLRYLEYVVSSEAYRQRVDSWVQSVTRSHQRASPEHIYKFWGAWPDLNEQRTIAAFLDRETARIDRLVAKKRELIERLKEKRTALIARAVTRGLPPAAARAAGMPANPPLKPSGVDWLGDIPAHWDVLKITHGFALIGSGTTPKSDSDEFYDGDVAWVTTSELRETLITSTKERITQTALSVHPTLRVYPAGTLLFAMYGATIGRLGMLGIAATVNQACCAFAHPTRFVIRYVFYWLWMRRPILVSLSSGGGQPNLSQDDLRQVRLTLPPQHEQLAIADYLDAETAKLDALVAKVETAIERLQEYRTALVTAAVTGKVDVRGEVPA